MKIIQLTAENIKKLKVVDITPKDAVVQVTGKNGSGKSSVLDSIWWALGGQKEIQAVPIRKGCESARIRLDLGDLIVERRFLASGSTTLTVRNAVGAEPGTPDKKLPTWGSPQEILDALFQHLSFDPLAFARKTPKDQLLELRRISKLEVDIDALDVANKADFTKRTDINRDAKAKRAQASGITIPPDLPKNCADETAILNQIEAAAEHNAAIETRKGRREQAERDAKDKAADAVRLDHKAREVGASADQRVADLRSQIEEIEKRKKRETSVFQAEAERARAEAAELENKLANAEPLPEPIQVSALKESLIRAKHINAAIQERERRDRINHEADELETRASALTKGMAERDKAKNTAIAAAKMPVDGLGFGDGMVIFGGLPFEQASSAEQLRISCSIAMAANARLRVIRIMDGSLLDDDGLKLISEMAAQHDYQVWIERVDSSGQVGVVMEDGEVKS